MIESELILRIAERNPPPYEKDVAASANPIFGQIWDAKVASDTMGR